MKSICFIGARGGSKGVPKKNIRMISDKPLIAHTIESAIDSKLFSHVVVSTENQEIMKVAKEYGAEVPFIRPKKFSTDSSGFGDVIAHGIKKLFSLGYNFETIVNRDCTVPFIRNKDIKGTIELIEKTKCDCVVGIYRQHLNPYFNIMEKNSKGFLKICKTLKKRPKSRQTSPIVYQLNGLFTYNANRFLKHKTPLPPKTLPYEIPQESGFMIDTELEFKMAEFLMKQKIFKNK
jgi:CMP-N,N'-diacetyllegionaminic acid synthase